jgi:hypothetical protein
MKLTELVKIDNILEKKVAYGITVDEFVVNLPYHMEEIGLLASKEDNGELSFDLLDVALALIANGVDVVIEVPYDFDMPAKDLLIVALNCGISISILAPNNGSESDYDKYSDILCEYTSLWLSQPNAVKMLYPSSGYLQYMINEVFNFKTPDISKDKYIIENFVKDIDIKIMDKMKDKLKLTIFEVFGGKDDFEVFAHSIANSLSETLIDKAS